MLFDYQILADDLVRDDSDKITDLQRDNAITQAVERYSQDRPRDKVEDVNGLGTQTLNLPAGWQADFSTLKSIEYPIGEVPPSFLEQDSYAIYQAPAGKTIILRQAIAAGAANVRATYTIRHQVAAALDSIPVGHREPVSCWAGAVLCDQLANLYAGQSDTTIQADAVDHKSNAAEYASRARALRTRYYNELGIDAKRNVPAGTVVNLNRTDSRGEERLLKTSRYR